MHRLLLTLLSIGLGILAFPPVHWHPLALVSPIPFLFALRDTRPAPALGLGLLYGVGLFAGTLNWLAALFGSFAILLFFILALFSTLFAAITASLAGPLAGRKWLPFAIGVLWTGTEYFRCEWFTLRFPWITPGTGLPPGYLTPWIGVYGVSLLVATAAAAIAFRQTKVGLTLLAAVALTAYLPQPSTPEGHLTVAAVQGEGVPFERLVALSKQAEAPLDAIVWPEISVVPDIRTKPKQLAAVRQLLAENKAAFLTVGTVTKLDAGRWSNTAVTIGPDTILGSYDKNRPVHFMDDGEPATSVPTIDTPLARLGTTICFDNDYAAVVRQAVLNGAELFLVPSMDAASWTARQHLQHAELARHRAAENGRWFVVSSSSGLTQVIDPRGRRIAELPLFDPGVLVAQVGKRSDLTFYTRLGWLIGPACTVLSVLLLIANSVLSRRQAATEREPTSASVDPTG